MEIRRSMSCRECGAGAYLVDSTEHVEREEELGLDGGWSYVH